MATRLTDEDLIWMFIGAATDALVSHKLKQKSENAPESDQFTYPSIISTGIISIPTLILAQTGLTHYQDPGLNRKVAAYLLGIGTSNILSYISSKIRKDEPSDATIGSSFVKYGIIKMM